MLKKIVETYKLNKIIRTLSFKKKLIKLHIGCGTNYFDGWLNIDNNSDNNINKLDVNWDLRYPLSIKESTVDFIYNEHFLEHLTVEEGQGVLRDFFRILRPGGVARIAMPDLEISIRRYLKPDWKTDPLINKFGFKFKTRAERINTVFRSWGHKWLYNDEELKRRLEESGFKNIVKCKFHKSKYRDLRNLETRKESTLIMEAKK